MKAQSYVDILTSILVLFELMTPKHYEQLLQSLKKQNEDWVKKHYFALVFQN